jgi:hypothetical protein|tara:strand:- start:1369 stop:1659 length:291 start_codon:yes stop_codon:yes gene_type:complete
MFNWITNFFKKEESETMENENSSGFTLDLVDVKNVGKNALLVGLAGALTYIGANLGEIDLGSAGLLIVPIVSILLDAMVKWAKNNQGNDEPAPPAV